jgi:hypothetical protein
MVSPLVMDGAGDSGGVEVALGCGSGGGGVDGEGRGP